MKAEVGGRVRLRKLLAVAAGFNFLVLLIYAIITFLRSASVRNCLFVLCDDGS